jgi:uncharacterized membrane protein
MPGLSFGLADVPWSFAMAFASLALIFGLFRRRSDLFDDLAFSGKEVALLALGSVAGWAVNIPVWVYGGTYLAVNVGGTLVPIFLIVWWIRRKKLPIVLTLIGTTLVAITAWKIVEFRADAGIIAKYPTFFLPVAVAFGFALLVSLRKPLAGVPIAYTSGTLGALIGADLMHMREIGAYFLAAPESTVISIGGAGVFDMVFLAGTFAMALQLIVALAMRRRAPAADPLDRYPTTPLTLADSRRVHESFGRLESPNALERALAGLALSDLSLKQGEHARSVRMSWLAVDSLLQSATLRAHMDNGVAPSLRDDVARLQERYVDTRGREPTLREAGEANMAAKILVSALAPRAGLRHQLEGVA